MSSQLQPFFLPKMTLFCKFSLTLTFLKVLLHRDSWAELGWDKLAASWLGCAVSARIAKLDLVSHKYSICNYSIMILANTNL